MPTAPDVTESADEPVAPQRLSTSFLASFFLGVSAVFVAVSGGHTTSIDDEIRYQTTRSLMSLRPSIADLNALFPGFYVLRSNGTFAGSYGLGQSIVALPFYAVGRVASWFGTGQAAEFATRVATFFTNSYVTAATATVLVIIAVELGASRRGALTIGLVFAFGTFAFPHSKTFFAEPGVALTLVLGVLLMIRIARKPSVWLAAWCGGIVGFGALFRLDAVLFLPVFGIFLLITVRRLPLARLVAMAVSFGLGAFVPLVFLFATNWWRYGSATTMGANAPSTTFPLVEGVVNLFFSPGKSVLLYAPPILAAFAAVIFCRRARTLMVWLCAALVVTNVVMTARLPFWHGDASWGPRYLQETLPVMLVPLVYVIDSKRWGIGVRTLGWIGFWMAALPAVLIYFNVFLVKAVNETGRGDFINATHFDMAWNPIMGEIELVPDGIRDALGTERITDVPRNPYLRGPEYDYGFFAHSPRLDFWWLWVGPTNSSRATYLLMVPLMLQVLLAIALHLRDRRSSHRSDERPQERIELVDVVVPREVGVGGGGT